MSPHHDDDYYNLPSEHESACVNAWTIIAVLILVVLTSIKLIFGG